MSVAENQSVVEAGTSGRKVWVTPQVDTIEMRKTEIGKSGDVPECIFSLGPDLPDAPICNLPS